MLTVNFIKHFFFKIIFFTALFCVVLPATAQESTAVKNKWNFLIEPYLMFPNIKGTTGVGTLPDAELEADQDDIFSNFKMGAILYFEMAKDKWAFSSDLVYMNLDQDVETGAVINSGNVNLKQFSWELAALRKLLPCLDAGIGGRYNGIKTSMDLQTKELRNGTTANSKSMDQSWFDPIIIARIKSTPGKKLIYQFRGDIGGFGIGSELAWQLQAYAGYRFSKLFQATAGYKTISADYEKGSGEDRFLYDVDTFGPVIRLGFNF